jgi:aquaporin Z
VGLLTAHSFPAAELPAYVIAQVLGGGIAGAAVLYSIANGKEGFNLANGFAANGYADHSPGGYALGACLIAEIVMTLMFLMIILGATDKRPIAG